MNINQWLENLGFSEYLELFLENEIAIDNLHEITTNADLIKIGIKSRSHRKKILIEIAVLDSQKSGKADKANKASSGKTQQKASHSSHKRSGEKIQRLNPSSHHRVNKNEEARSIKKDFENLIDEGDENLDSNGVDGNDFAVTQGKIKKSNGIINIGFLGKFIGSLILSVTAIVLFIFFFSFQIYNTPKFDYDANWFVTAKNGYLMWNSTAVENKTQKFKKKTSLTPGIQLKPIATHNDYWIQAETPRGQRGFVYFTLLEGAKYVEAKSDAIVFKKIGSNTGDTVMANTKASVIKRSQEVIHDSVTNFIKLKFEDGSIGWANNNDFKQLIFYNMPSINQEYYYPTSIDIAEQNIIGSSLDEIELHYGIATSYIKGIGKNQAYFGNLIVVDQKKHYRGLMLNLTKKDTAVSFEFIGEPLSRYYDYLPFINAVRRLEAYSLHNSTNKAIKLIRDKKLEPNRIFSFLFYQPSGFFSDFQKTIFNGNWFSRAFGWIINTFLYILLLGVLFSIPRLIVAPFMLLVENISMMNGIFVRLINFTIYFIATYLFLLVMVMMMDQVIVPLLASSLVFYYWIIFREDTRKTVY